MKKCFECGYVFDEPRVYTEDYSPGECFEGGSFIYKYEGCPGCGGSFASVEECCACGEYEYLTNGEITDEGFVCQHCCEDEEE